MIIKNSIQISKYVKNIILPLICSIAYAFSCVIGYYATGSFDYVHGIFSIIDGALFWSAYKFLNYALPMVVHKKSEGDTNKFLAKIKSCLHEEGLKSFLKLFLILFIVWLPYLIIKYPGVQSGGVVYQLMQSLGIDTEARQLSAIVYEGHFISGHHPVLLTLVFGLFLKLGIALNNPNIGMFLLSLIICLLNVTGWTYVIYQLKIHIKNYSWLLVYLFFCINPVIANWNTYVLKDNLFTTLLGVYCILILKKIHWKDAKKHDNLILIAISILIPFVKNQGIYIVLLTSFILLIFDKNRRRFWIKCVVIPFIAFNLIFLNIICPIAQIGPGGRQEALSIFCQSSAQVIKDHGNDLNNSEIMAIEKVFPVDDWSAYVPGNADIIKFQFNQSCNNKDLWNYFYIWIKLGFKYPKSYIKAFIYQTYGYYFVDYEANDWCINTESELNLSDEVTISSPIFPDKVAEVSHLVYSLISQERIKYFFNIGIAFWTIIIFCLIIIGKGMIKDILWILPTVLQYFICFLSPVNGSVRYAMIVYMMMPVVFSILIEILIDKQTYVSTS